MHKASVSLHWLSSSQWTALSTEGEQLLTGPLTITIKKSVALSRCQASRASTSDVELTHSAFLCRLQGLEWSPQWHIHHGVKESSISRLAASSEAE